MTAGATKQSPVTLDLSDVDPRVGQLVGGGQLWEPCSATDIRRWVQAMDYPNPIHWDEEFASKSKFGGIVAPQSFVVCMDYGHGVHPACVGQIPGSHLIFGGEEWWFYGPRIRPGDRLFQERRFHGYKVTDTKFAGPTMFSSGDTVHSNQHGVPVAKERSTSIRYLAAEAEKRGFFAKQLEPIRRWTRDELKQIAKLRHEWLMSNRDGRLAALRGGRGRRQAAAPRDRPALDRELRLRIPRLHVRCLGHLALGDPGRREGSLDHPGFGLDRRLRLRRGGAPRSTRACATVSSTGPPAGTSTPNAPARSACSGPMATARRWAPGPTTTWPSGPATTATSVTPRPSSARPAFEGDVTYFEAEVSAKTEQSAFGTPTVTVQVKLTNQDGAALVDAAVEVELPL